jgi:hypothetical protein
MSVLSTSLQFDNEKILALNHMNQGIHDLYIQYLSHRKHTRLHYKDHQLINLLKPTGHVKHQQFNIQQLYVLPTLYLCVLYLSENKQRFVSLTA